MPANFHYTGPFHDVRVRPPAPFPWERLSGRPLIYASMGTLQNRMRHVFGTIAEACRDLDADLSVLTVVWFQDEYALPIQEPALSRHFSPEDQAANAV